MVPGAVCGNGQPYPVFVRKGDPKKALLTLQGGGACWDHDSCYGKLPKASLKPPRKPKEKGGLLSDNPRVNPLASYTQVYFPYCTGDVHIGNHMASYEGKDVHHVGAANIPKAIRYLEQHVGIRLGELTDVVMYGFSAGAFGAPYHAMLIDHEFALDARKTLISDAPGLHFGSKFWVKFTDRQISDYSEAMALVGYELDETDGHLAELIPAACERLSGWTVGVLQGAYDVTMSILFGATTPWKHAQRVYGRNGVYSLTVDPTDNCSAWVPQTPIHTFLKNSFWSRHIHATSGGRVSAMDFVLDLVSGRGGRNYR